MDGIQVVDYFFISSIQKQIEQGWGETNRGPGIVVVVSAISGVNSQENEDFFPIAAAGLDKRGIGLGRIVDLMWNGKSWKQPFGKCYPLRSGEAIQVFPKATGFVFPLDALSSCWNSVSLFLPETNFNLGVYKGFGWDQNSHRPLLTKTFDLSKIASLEMSQVNFLFSKLRYSQFFKLRILHLILNASIKFK
jgi:hypothetical protein